MSGTMQSASMISWLPASNRLAASAPSLTGTTAIPSPRSRSKASFNATGTRSTSTTSGAAPAAARQRA